MLAVNEADPRVRRTRKLLQDALLALLAEKSFDDITVQDIAERSTINRATFYTHYVDKYDLFSSYTRDWFRDALHKRLPDGVPFNRPNLRLLILASMESLAGLDDHCRPTEALKPLVMSAVQEELSAFVLHWLQQTDAESHRFRHTAAACDPLEETDAESDCLHQADSDPDRLQETDAESDRLHQPDSDRDPLPRTSCGDGRATPRVPLETTAAGLSWAIFGTALDWSRMPERSPADATAAQIATLLIEGLPLDP
jgi:AcrR family transcriptional regulator